MPIPFKATQPVPFPDPERRATARRLREQAAALSAGVENPGFPMIVDELAPFPFSFRKGLEHQTNGVLADAMEFETFRDATQQHDPAFFDAVPAFRSNTYLTATIGTFNAIDPRIDPHREWESPTAGHAFSLIGPDTFSMSMPVAPRAGSAEFAAEMAEVYQMALSRDWPVAAFMDAGLVAALETAEGGAVGGDAMDLLAQAQQDVEAAAARLSGMRWFEGRTDGGLDIADPEERARRRFGEAQTARTLFRGQGEDGWATPFVSQFMVMGADNPKHEVQDRATGLIGYGAQKIDQRVDIAHAGTDYMTRWEPYLDVQNGMNARALTRDQETTGQRRLISRLRDLATYVHDDQLYQGYLNAALILLRENYAFDRGLPYHANTATAISAANQTGFALFGGPDLLAMVTAVSSYALKAVRLQKFSVHRRLRPEAAGALFHTIYSGYEPNRGMPGAQPYSLQGDAAEARTRRALRRTLARYTFPDGEGTEPVLSEILAEIRLHNEAQNAGDPAEWTSDPSTWLLPMAFAEGSPMHPAYGAGHATVAGACVTVLKAFFEMGQKDDAEKPAYFVEPGGHALVPGGGLQPDDVTEMLRVAIPEGLTLEGELNKLMWNVSNARNIAGVHYYTDYVESALLGEAITIGALREAMVLYHPNERVTMTVPLLVERTLPPALLGPGASIRPDEPVEAVLICSDGTLRAAAPSPGRGR